MGAKVWSIYNFTMTYSQLLDKIGLQQWSPLEWELWRGCFQLSSLLKTETRPAKQQRTGLVWTGKHREDIWYLLNHNENSIPNLRATNSRGHKQSEGPQSLREGKVNKMVCNGNKQRKETSGQGQFNMLDNLHKYEINLDRVQSIFRATQSDTNSHLFYYLPSSE